MENNKLIEDCLAELANNAEARERFNSLAFGEIFTQLLDEFWFIGDDQEEDNISRSQFLIQGSKTIGSFNNLYTERKLHIILTLLSATPDGQAVMPFLDVETEKYKNLKDQEEMMSNAIQESEGAVQPDYQLIELLQNTPKTLRQLLLQEFTRVCFGEGQGFDKALETINLIYLKYV